MFQGDGNRVTIQRKHLHTGLFFSDFIHGFFTEV